jgi:NAD(P)H-dependent nitrite reductase large subunit/NAD(P)H-dependent nitrite reductase small subunit
MSWQAVCALDDVLPNTGVCVWAHGRQVAVFRLAGESLLFAIDNFDPGSNANVLSRGIVGDLKGELVVASPVYKQHYSLTTGRCLENPDLAVATHRVRVRDGHIEIGSASQRAARDKPALVVVGNGMAGMRTVEELLAIAPERYAIHVFGAEPHGNYNRILLSPVLSGEKKAAEIVINPPAWYAERGIVLHSGETVMHIDRRRRVVTTASGITQSYDRLLLATGSNPVTLPLPGRELPGVVTFRDLQDVEAMLSASKQYRRAVVIGGGLLGLEAANGLKRQGMDVTVVHLIDRLMERQLDAPAAALLRESLEARGLKFRMPAKTAGIVGDDRVAGVRLEDGELLPADLVVMAVGIRPNIELAKASGLRCDRGLLVDDTLQTFDPRVYAVGECVQHRNATYGLVAPLWEQARVCATHLAERGNIRYRGSVTSTQLKVSGIEVFSAGDFGGGQGAEDLVLRDPRRGVYKRLVIRDNRIAGAVLYGETSDGNWYFELMQQRADIGPLRERLLFGKAFCQAA